MVDELPIHHRNAMSFLDMLTSRGLPPGNLTFDDDEALLTWPRSVNIGAISFHEDGNIVAYVWNRDEPHSIYELDETFNAIEPNIELMDLLAKII